MGNTVASAMTFEDITPAKSVSKKVVKNEVDKVLNQFSFGQMLWHNIRRHKFGLTMTWAIFMTSVYVMPEWPRVVFGWIGLLLTR